MTDKFEGTCSVCLRVIQLKIDRPIRHGFQAFDVRHGQTGGYHTGPCKGVDFPYLGISTAGTKWGLADVNKRLDIVLDEIRGLKARPTLTWYPPLRARIGVSVPDLKNGQTVKPGDDRRYYQSPNSGYSESVPSYDELLKRKLSAEEGLRDQLARQQDKYESVLASWTPEKYAAKGAVSKDVIHMAHEYNSPRFGTYTAQLCRSVRPGGRGSSAKLTTDRSKVTCGACKKQLGTRH